MVRHFKGRVEPNRPRSAAALLTRALLVACSVALAGLSGLPACSPLPDDANPARLIRGTDNAPVPGESEEFPNLASVPDKPRPASSIEEIKATQASLAAERERARRTDRAVRAGVLADDTARLDAIEPVSIGFELGSAALSDESRAALRQLADELGRSGGTARIVGWAGGSDRGADHTLAKARADAVAAELERLGVSPERIVAFAATDLELAETAESAAGQRADIFVEP